MWTQRWKANVKRSRINQKAQNVQNLVDQQHQSVLYQCILTLWDFNKLNKCTLFWRKRHFSPHASLCLRAWKPCSGCDGAVWRASNRSRMWWRGAKFHQGWYEHFRVGILPAVSHTRGSSSGQESHKARRETWGVFDGQDMAAGPQRSH